MPQTKQMFGSLALCMLLLMNGWNARAEEDEGDAEAISVQTHGFISQGFLKSERNNVFEGTKDGTFQFNEFGVTFLTDLFEQLHAGIQLFSRDLGDLGNNEVTLDWAFGDYRWRDWLGIRLGKIKIPYGFYNETRDVDMFRTSIFLPSSVYYEGERDKLNTLIGGGLYGNVSAGSFGALSYHFQIGDANVESGSGDVKYAQNENSAVTEMQIDRQYTADLEWETPLEGLKLGAFAMQSDLTITTSTTTATTTETTSATTTTMATDANSTPPEATDGDSAGDAPHAPDDSRQFYIFSAEYSIGDAVMSGEYLCPADSRAPEGYYFGAAYRLKDRYEFGAYYSVYYAHSRDKDGKKREHHGGKDYSAWQKEWVASVRVDLNKYWTIKAEGHLIDGTAQILSQDNSEGTKRDSYLFALKTTYHF